MGLSQSSGGARYESPLVTRYASAEMSRLFSPEQRIRTWRRLWVALAEAQREVGVAISQEQIEALRSAAEGPIDFERAREYEARTRHDVMAHVLALGEAAPAARGIIHLGATSAFVVDNADLLILREALDLVLTWVVNVVEALAEQARRHRDVACLGYTHFQPAQPTTIGKRAAMWCADFLRDVEQVEFVRGRIRLRGVKGATGTQASFLALVGGDRGRVEEMERRVAAKLGVEAVEPVTGQTASRKVDAEALAALGHIAVSVHKLANDLRLLSHTGEVLEPAEAAQVGSSAMPYKRNPMRCERMTGLSRVVLSLVPAAMQTAAEQWLERSLDDSAARRVVVPEAFLAADGMLRVAVDVCRRLVVRREVIADRLREHLPLVCMEAILLEGVRRGGDRQDLHERLRQHARAAEEAAPGRAGEELLRRLREDAVFAGLEWERLLAPEAHTGRAGEQVDRFLSGHVEPVLKRYADRLGRPVALTV